MFIFLFGLVFRQKKNLERKLNGKQVNSTGENQKTVPRTPVEDESSRKERVVTVLS